MQDKCAAAAEVDIARLMPLEGLLLDWYDKNRRVLPWREEPTPYRVWISEVMLQQTRVDTAVPYFERFVQALPDVYALAEAEEDRLLKLWEGLGYYSRARNLRRAARQIIAEYDGRLPDSAAELRKLPGIGEYAAGAIASIAFGRRESAVDGNALRVLARLTDSGADIAKPEVKRAFARLAAALMSRRPGDFNQAVMDLGAGICLPGAPRCTECPLISICGALAAGRQNSLPVKGAAPVRTVEKRTIVLAVHHGGLLVCKRQSGLLGAMWEPLNLEGWLNEAQLADALGARGLSAVSLWRLPDAKHVFTHVEWRMRGYLAEVRAKGPGVWAAARELQAGYALPSAFKTYMRIFYQQAVDGPDAD